MRNIIKTNLAIMMEPSQNLLVRFMLSIMSLSWALFLTLTIIHDGKAMVSPTQELLNSVVPAIWWVILHSIQGTFGIAGTLMGVRSRLFAIFDSFLAALLWSCSTSVMMVGYLSLGHDIPPVWSAQIVMTVFAIWSLIGTRYGR
jgi:hypothetical protein